MTPSGHLALSPPAYDPGMEWALLRALPPDEVRRVLARATRRRFAKRDILFHEGDPADTLHLIDRGRVAVRVTTPRGDVATVDVLFAGHTAGEQALVSGEHRRMATVVALERTETLVIDERTFATLCREYPPIVATVNQLLATRIRKLDARLLEALYLPVDKRLLRRLLELTETYGETVPLTQDDLAGMAGTTRATVNRLLRKEEQAGSVVLCRGQIKIVDHGSLVRRAR